MLRFGDATRDIFVYCKSFPLISGVRDTNYPLAIHDIKLLLLRFAYEKSFSDETGGGGQESNLHLVPYLFQVVLYVLNTTRFYQREEKNLAQVKIRRMGIGGPIECGLSRSKDAVVVCYVHVASDDRFYCIGER